MLYCNCLTLFIFTVLSTFSHASNVLITNRPSHLTITDSQFTGSCKAPSNQDSLQFQLTANNGIIASQILPLSQAEKEYELSFTVQLPSDLPKRKFPRNTQFHIECLLIKDGKPVDGMKDRRQVDVQTEDGELVGADSIEYDIVDENVEFTNNAEINSFNEDNDESEINSLDEYGENSEIKSFSDDEFAANFDDFAESNALFSDSYAPNFQSTGNHFAFSSVARDQSAYNKDLIELKRKIDELLPKSTEEKDKNLSFNGRVYAGATRDGSPDDSVQNESKNQNQNSKTRHYTSYNSKSIPRPLYVPSRFSEKFASEPPSVALAKPFILNKRFSRSFIGTRPDIQNEPIVVIETPSDRMTDQSEHNLQRRRQRSQIFPSVREWGPRMKRREAVISKLTESDPFDIGKYEVAMVYGGADKTGAVDISENKTLEISDNKPIGVVKVFGESDHDGVGHGSRFGENVNISAYESSTGSSENNVDDRIIGVAKIFGGADHDGEGHEPKFVGNQNMSTYESRTTVSSKSEQNIASNNTGKQTKKAKVYGGADKTGALESENFRQTTIRMPQDLQQRLTFIQRIVGKLMGVFGVLSYNIKAVPKDEKNTVIEIQGNENESIIKKTSFWPINRYGTFRFGQSSSSKRPIVATTNSDDNSNAEFVREMDDTAELDSIPSQRSSSVSANDSVEETVELHPESPVSQLFSTSFFFGLFAGFLFLLATFGLFRVISYIRHKRQLNRQLNSIEQVKQDEAERVV